MNTSPPSQPAAERPRLTWRWLISLLLLFHLTAVFTAPFAFATSTGPGMASPLAASAMFVFQPYLDAAFLNHGYFFFAPNPGPNHLVRYRLELADGVRQEGVFPDRHRQFPRLLYHRHFMLSEQLHALYQTPNPLGGERAPQIDDVAGRRRQLYFLEKQSFANHLRHVTGAERVELTRLRHRQPGIQEFLYGRVKLTDESLYSELSDEAVRPAGGNER